MLFVICVAVAAALAGTNLLTEERIAQQAVATAEESRKVVLPGAEEFQAQDDGAYYTGSAGGQLVGYVFETEASGYGGQGEGDDRHRCRRRYHRRGHPLPRRDPGLGRQRRKADFLNQFLQQAPEGGLEVIKYQTPGEGQIQAMTGGHRHLHRGDQRRHQAIAQYNTVKGGA